MTLELKTGTDAEIALSLFEANGITPLNTTGWTIHAHVKVHRDATPMLALSSASATQIAPVNAATGLWTIIIPKTATLPVGAVVLQLFGDTDDAPSKRRDLGEHTVDVVHGWTLP
jgi:hypothetical protein